MDVRRVARQRDPAERSAALGEQRADVLRHEAGIAEGIGESGFLGLAAQVVPVVECDRAGLRERDDRLAVARDRLARPLHVALRIAIATATRGLDTRRDVRSEGARV